MEYELLTFINGRWKQNCYIIANSSKDALVIDPGSEPEKIITLVDEHQLHVHAILNTHAHFDHVGAVAMLMEHYQIPFYLHKADERLLQRANLFRLLFEAHTPIRVPVVTHDLSACPETFQAGPFRVSWRFIPGHTEGSVCFGIGRFLFTGDTLMPQTIGRTDLPGGNRERLLGSVRDLMSLPPELIVCGGHGERTTLGNEFAPGSPVWKLLQ